MASDLISAANKCGVCPRVPSNYTKKWVSSTERYRGVGYALDGVKTKMILRALIVRYQYYTIQFIYKTVTQSALFFAY